MKAAICGISAVLGLVFLVIAPRFGAEGSWGIAILFFLLFGGAEVTAYALDAPRHGRGTAHHAQ